MSDEKMLGNQHFDPIPRSFFDRPAVEVAPDLLGAVLINETAGGPVGGVIVETEAYMHDDPAFHAWGVVDPPTGLVKPTGRAYDLFGPPGQAYVYLCYGMYWLLNVVTEREGVPGCVLVRAVQPVVGLDIMWSNRSSTRQEIELTNGPGKLTIAMGIDKSHHKTDLTSPPLYFANRDSSPLVISTSARIGLSRAIDRQWRFFLTNNPYVSRGIPSDIAAERRRATRKLKP